MPGGRRAEASVVVPLQPQVQKSNESYLRKELDIRSKRVAELETRVEELTIQTQVCGVLRIIILYSGFLFMGENLREFRVSVAIYESFLCESLFSSN